MVIPETRRAHLIWYLRFFFILVHTQTQRNLLMVILFIYQTNIVRDKLKHVNV